MRTARIFSELSTARRLHVGAIAVRDGRIISIGYNGTPAGWDNNCETELPDGSLKTRPEVLHAEMNCLMKLARSNESGDQATMFITHSPCLECAKGIYQAGIREVYYAEEYRDSAGIDFLRKCNIQVIQVPEIT